MIDFITARKKMVENQLRTSNITDRRVLSVMAQVPREIFVPEGRRDLAYIDEAHVLLTSGAPRYLAAPAPFARMVQLAGVQTDDTVLDLGCGTGYSSAVLGNLAARVVGVESDPGLVATARANLASLALDNVEVVEGPLNDDVPVKGKFDVILLEGAVTEVPHALFAHLAEEGRLVVLVREGAASVAHLYVKSGNDVAGRAEFNTSLPPLPAIQKASEFVF